MTIASAWIFTLFMVFIRMSTVLLFTPIQAIRLLPKQLRFLFAFFLSLFVSLQLSPAQDESTLLSSALSEFMNGLILSLGLYAAFSVINIVGHLIDNQTGFNAISIFNPAEKSQDSPTSRLLPMLATLIFFSANFHHRLLEGLLYSFKMISPGTLIIFDGFHKIMTQFALMFSMAFAIASPLVIALVTIELTGGLLTRQMPQINPYFLTLPVKIILGLFLLFILIGFMNPVVNGLFNQFFTHWQELMQ